MGVSFNLCGPSLIFLFFSFFFALILEKNDVYESPQVYLIDLLVLRCGSLSCPLVMFMVKLSKVGVPFFPSMDSLPPSLSPSLSLTLRMTLIYMTQAPRQTNTRKPPPSPTQPTPGPTVLPFAHPSKPIPSTPIAGPQVTLSAFEDVPG